MGDVPSNRAWVYDRNYSGRRGLKESFVKGVEEFIQIARQYKYYEPDGGIRCPCIKCDLTKILKDEVVKVHLYKHGFKPNYWIWIDHGEEMPRVDLHEDDNCSRVEGVDRKRKERPYEIKQLAANYTCGNVVDRKRKVKPYVIKQLAANYTCANDSLKQQRLTSSCNNEDLTQLRQQNLALKKENEQLKQQQLTSSCNYEDLTQLRQQILALKKENEQLKQQQLTFSCNYEDLTQLRQQILALKKENEQLKQQPLTSSCNCEYLTQLRQEILALKKENEQLTREFQSLRSLVMQFVPPDARLLLQQQQSNTNLQNPEIHQEAHSKQQQND
ncbi:WEB family protein At4g27595, chloroplastic-like [Vigna unguiculata]|uniref:WEB family protein At4g27595, chloroplastic-like n=1 Tax=Vigna unguiculata TaxID=3917 RepID=UPI001015EC6A|nr:WEB family protein At4g27595, chloroplastic-like [Vigna unguiculata]XP_027917118.1 WEB family protein At4g27595, chloroplastic-like [Vigna unguiculata]XP_027917119.1 WEB family protein At4g27595, chloroplastic-like [Vigna unguiculata]XP_027917120.1 WEB family protein At4g27595, chloroplastic-like [Vigna unguiculata]XP_027917121.1 WEB family protein At4g27595, chloroplastic-like [Vigna unguiculata]XP_027917122.1 WEB family protein At4g27595, chloroplastic-like [Vigna unguiculata]